MKNIDPLFRTVRQWLKASGIILSAALFLNADKPPNATLNNWVNNDGKIETKTVTLGANTRDYTKSTSYATFTDDKGNRHEVDTTDRETVQTSATIGTPEGFQAPPKNTNVCTPIKPCPPPGSDPAAPATGTAPPDNTYQQLTESHLDKDKKYSVDKYKTQREAIAKEYDLTIGNAKPVNSLPSVPTSSGNASTVTTGGTTPVANTPTQGSSTTTAGTNPSSSGGDKPSDLVGGNQSASTSASGSGSGSGTAAAGTTLKPKEDPNAGIEDKPEGLTGTSEPASSTPNKKNGNSILSTARMADEINRNALAMDLLNKSREFIRKNEQDQKHDQDLVDKKATEVLTNLDPKDILPTLDKAQDKLKRESNIYADIKPSLDKGGVDRGDIDKHQIMARYDAIKKIDDAKALVANSLRNPSQFFNNLNEFLGFNKPKGTGKKDSVDPEVAQTLRNTLFEVGDPDGKGGNRAPASNSASAHINQLLGLALLPEKERAYIESQLRLAEKRQVTLNSGETVSVLIIHAGYLLGGGKTAMDCSSFVSNVLPTNFSKARLTTLDLLAIWKYQTEGIFPKPPVYESSRAEFVKRFAKAFIPINPYAGDIPLLPGDLLLYRVPGVAIGHVLVVESYDSRRYVAQVIEAAQSAGTIRRRDYYLSQHPTKRVIRPGLLVLRMKSQDNASCRYPAGKKNKVGEQGGAQ